MRRDDLAAPAGFKPASRQMPEQRQDVLCATMVDAPEWEWSVARVEVDVKCPGWQHRTLLACAAAMLMLSGCTTPSQPARAEATPAHVVLRLAAPGDAPAVASWKDANAFQISTQPGKPDPGVRWAIDYSLEGLYDIGPAPGTVHFRVDRAKFVRRMPLMARSREPAVVVVGIELGLCHFVSGDEGPWEFVAGSRQRSPVLTLDTSLQPLTEYTLQGPIYMSITVSTTVDPGKTWPCAIMYLHAGGTIPAHDPRWLHPPT